MCDCFTFARELGVTKTSKTFYAIGRLECKAKISAWYSYHWMFGEWYNLPDCERFLMERKVVERGGKQAWSLMFLQLV